MVVIVEDDSGGVKHARAKAVSGEDDLGEGATPSQEAAAFQAPLGTSSFTVLGKIITLTGAVTVHPGTPVAAGLLQPDSWLDSHPSMLLPIQWNSPIYESSKVIFIFSFFPF